MKIIPYNQLNLSQKKSIKAIFFNSSVQTHFQNESLKEKFFYKYLGFYLEDKLSFCYAAIDSQGHILGYICGRLETNDSKLFEIQPHLKEFEKYYERFPAHLHINLAPQARGRGIGSFLVNHTLHQIDIDGIHIITSQGARNQSFYKRLGFRFTAVSSDSTLCFMGRS